MPRIRKVLTVLPAMALAVPLAALASAGNGNSLGYRPQFPQPGGHTMARSAANGSAGSAQASNAGASSAQPGNGNPLGHFHQFPEPGNRTLAGSVTNGNASGTQAGNASAENVHPSNGSPLGYSHQFPKKP